MKLYVRILERLLELPECAADSAATSVLRHTLDDLGLEVKGVEFHADRGVVFNIETLANRGDHLYALGVARELSSRTLAKISLPNVAAQLSDRKAAIPVRRLTDKCSRYAALEMSLPSSMSLRNDVAIFIDDPSKRHPIVNLLNYVQLELGQPMHAFDAAKIDGEIVIDCATQLEQVEALDGRVYQVPEGSILIRDRKKIIAVAGVIGCANSMVTESTTKVCIEAAIFDPVTVRKTARAMGISTDASYAFERGVDPEGVAFSLKRLVFLAAGASGAVVDSSSAHVLGYTYLEGPVTEKRKVRVKLSYLRKQLNLLKLEELEVVTRFKNLGYSVDVSELGKDREFTLGVPSWRLYDVSGVDDILEDIARAISLNRVRQELPPLQYDSPARNTLEEIAHRARPALCGAGFVEVVTRGFYSSAEVALLDSLSPGVAARHVAVKNSLEASNSHMKLSNVIDMARILSANLKRGVVAPKIYDYTRVFELPTADDAVSDEPRERDSLEYNYESDRLTLASAGRWSDNEWRKGESLEEHGQLFKGALAAIVKGLGGVFSVSKSENPFLHPGIQTSIKMGRSIVGVFGVIHPLIRAEYDLRIPAWYAEFDLRLVARFLSRGVSSGCEVFSDLPAISRDVTLMIDKKAQAGRVVRIVKESEFANPENAARLRDVMIVDDFTKTGEEFRRVTYRIVFQSRERTLTHEEVDSAMMVIFEDLRAKHGILLAQ
jgi:phenylalanyl-tRNA synthetase beta chain